MTASEIRVARTSVTPVKGTRLHHPEEIEVLPSGVVGNRRFLFIDEQGATYKAGRLGPLMGVVAEADGDSLTFALPGGTVVRAPALTDPEVIEVDLWGRSFAARRIPGPWDEAVSGVVGLPLRLVEPIEPGAANDDEPVTLLSLASVAALAREAGVAAIDPDRFRMTLDIDGVEAHEEDSWAGRHVMVGSVELRVIEPVPRCLLTTWDPSSGVRDLDTLKFIRNYRGRTPDGIPFGMYASVVQPGVVRVGDEIQLVDAP